MQHSMTPKSQRQWASSSAMAMNTDSNQRPSASSLSSSMASMSLKSPSQIRAAPRGSWYGLSGPFLVRQAFEELCIRCDGAVIFVSLTDAGGVVDLHVFEEEPSRDYPGDGSAHVDYDGVQSSSQILQRRTDALQKFRRNGAWVDLSSDPFGWEGETEGDSDDDSVSILKFKTTMNKLQPIAVAIQDAACAIESRRMQCQILGQREKEQRVMQQPIPIVFETLTPLLNVHGAEKVCVLLKSLSRADTSPDSVQTILSPIVAPVLYESLRPAEHRLLEDASDAMLHLTLMDAQGSSAYAPTDTNTTRIVSGVMDMARRGGGGGLGGKFICHCVPFHVMRSSSTSTFSDARDGCYWILEHDDNPAEEKTDSVKQAAAKRAEGVDEAKKAPSSTSRPRIYLQDDDPEYDDYDEEDDLDDDLDL